MARAAAEPRGRRTRSAWLLALPFLALAAPRADTLAAGAVVAALGLLLRGWAAGTIRKDEELTITGPYAYLRHPLYVGSFLIATGLAVAGGHWIWPALVVGLFAATYRATMVEERERLSGLFGRGYLEYAEQVPAFVPRLTPYRGRASQAGQGFTPRRYARNREWEALLGAMAALAVLAAKMRWLG